jgi:uncharacterized protein YjeT (DUF2065 family)
MKKGVLAPLTGAFFVVLAIVAFTISGEPPDVEDPVAEIVDHYVDNKDSVIFGAVLATIAGLMLILFANFLRRTFTAAGEAPLAPVALVGASIMAVGIAIDSTISFALAEAVDDIDPTSVQALQALWDNDFLPIALGTVTFLLGSGVSILQTGVLPKWLGWIAIALVAIGLTPLGWIAFLAGGIWVLVVSILLAVRGSSDTATPAPPPAATG